MLLRPIHIQSDSNSDSKNKGSILSATGPELPYKTETSNCNKTQESLIKDSTMKKSGQPSKTLTVLENQIEEISTRPHRNRPMNNDKTYKKKFVSWNCKEKLLDISLFRNPFFYIFTWSFLLSQLAYFIPTFHLVARAKTLGINIMDASYLVSVAGKKNLFQTYLHTRENKLSLVSLLNSTLKQKEKEGRKQENVSVLWNG